MQRNILLHCEKFWRKMVSSDKALVKLCIVFVFCMTCVQCVASETMIFEKIPGTRMNNKYKESVVKSALECGAECSTNQDGCHSANYRSSDGRCQLSADRYPDGGHELSAPWEVYSLKTVSPGWTRFQGWEYLLISEHRQWNEAKNICESYSAYLTDISSDAEYSFIESLIDSSGYGDPYWWLGATDQAVEGDWRWQPGGNPATEGYTRWRAGNPDDYPPGEDCLCMSYGILSVMDWNDCNCIDPRPSICKRSL